MKSKIATNTENQKKLSLSDCQMNVLKESSHIDAFGPLDKVEATSPYGTMNVEEELDNFDENDIQDWRKTRGKSVIPDRRPLPPSQPTTASDIWSVGCLITEALTGRKLF